MLLIYLCTVNVLAEEFVMPAYLFPRGGSRGARLARPRSAWLVQSTKISMVAGTLLWMMYKLVLLALGAGEARAPVSGYFDLMEAFLVNLGPIIFIIVAGLVLVRCTPEAVDALAGRLDGGGMSGVADVVFCGAAHRFLLDVHALPYRPEDVTRLHPCGETMGTSLCRRSIASLGCLDYIWLDLRQRLFRLVAGGRKFMFRREMAMEGQRRACVIAPFQGWRDIAR